MFVNWEPMDYFTFDPGFLATASCESQITYIDGGKGILLHRGYPIDQLANNADYLEVCYILLYGEAPTREQYEQFKTTLLVTLWCMSKSQAFFHGFRRDAHPMAVMCGVVGALAAFYHDSLRYQQRRAPRNRGVPSAIENANTWRRCVTSTQSVSHSSTHVTT